MKALSLWQPWATLVALGHKRYETRHWVTSYRGPIAIHAAKKIVTWPTHAGELLHGHEIPYGAIVAVGVLVEIESTNVRERRGLSLHERAFGDWSLNRYAWKLTDVQAIRPLELRGRQGLWSLERETVEEIRRRLPQ